MSVPPISQLTVLPMEFVYEGAEYIFGEPFFYFFFFPFFYSRTQSDLGIFSPVSFLREKKNNKKKKRKNKTTEYRQKYFYSVRGGDARAAVRPFRRDGFFEGPARRAGKGPSTDSNYTQ